MGYIIVAALLLLFFVFVGIAIFSAVSPSRSLSSDRPAARDPGLPDPGHPVSREEPASDEPTPGASDTADPDTIRNAQRRTPPS